MKKEAQAHARPDKPDRNRKKMKVAEEPERHLIDDSAVPFILGDVVDRFSFDGHLLRSLRFSPVTVRGGRAAPG
jgi:hypothetical protein